MSIQVKINKNEISKLQAELKRIKDLRQPLDEIGQSLEASTKLRFNQGKDPEGNPWEPRSEAYKAYLKRIGKLNNKVLVLSGDLQKSIEYVSDDKEVVVGTDIKYAEKHQLGLDGLPIREFLGLSEKDKKEILEIIEDHIE